MGFTAIGRFLVHRRRLVLGLGRALRRSPPAVTAPTWPAGSRRRLRRPERRVGAGRAATCPTTMGAGLPNLVLLVRADRRGGHRRAPGRRPWTTPLVAAGEAVTARLAAEPGVTQVASYWSARAGRRPCARPPATAPSSSPTPAATEDEVNAIAQRIIEHLRPAPTPWSRCAPAASPPATARPAPSSRRDLQAGRADRPAHHARSCCCSCSAASSPPSCPSSAGSSPSSAPSPC